MAAPVPPGVAIARADVAARALFRDGVPPSPDAIYAQLRPVCGSALEIVQVWDIVLVRLAEMQAAADGYPARSINERAA